CPAGAALVSFRRPPESRGDEAVRDRPVDDGRRSAGERKRGLRLLVEPQHVDVEPDLAPTPSHWSIVLRPGGLVSCAVRWVRPVRARRRSVAPACLFRAMLDGPATLWRRKA